MLDTRIKWCSVNWGSIGIWLFGENVSWVINDDTIEHIGNSYFLLLSLNWTWTCLRFTYTDPLFTALETSHQLRQEVSLVSNFLLYSTAGVWPPFTGRHHAADVSGAWHDYLGPCTDSLWLTLINNIYWFHDDVIKLKVFRVTGSLWEKSTGHWWIPLTKASDAELWFLLWFAPEQTVEHIIELLAIWDTIGLIMTSLKCAIIALLKI